MRAVLTTAIAALMVLSSLAGCISTEEDNKAPKAYAGDDLEAEVGQEVVFSGTGLDKDGSVTRYRWDFEGDGSWDFEGEFGARIHIYTRPGDYQAVLQVTDDEGATATDTRWVNVTATIAVTVDWANGTGFRIAVSDRLDVANLEVDWTLHGAGPTPVGRTFTRDAGLERLDNTTLAFDPELSGIEEGDRHVVRVRLRDLVLATRTVEVVLSSDAEGPYTARYYSETWDYELRGEDWTDHFHWGNLTVEKGTGWVRESLLGEGLETSFTNRSGVRSRQQLNLTEVTVEEGEGSGWGEASWRHAGNGSIEQWGEGGLYVFAKVNDHIQEVENGTITRDDWRRVGLYRGNDTNLTKGTFHWFRESAGNMVRQNGEGDLYEVLRVESWKDFEGRNGGMDFFLHNRTVDYDASRLSFDNRTIVRESDQQVGYRDGEEGNWTYQNTTFDGFLDTDADGVFNPDVMPFDLGLAAVFTGPRPRVLEVGDTFTATNFYGVKLRYTAKRADNSTLDTLRGEMEVHGVLAEALHSSAWGNVTHWFWVLRDGPLPGLVFEERVSLWHPAYGGGTYERYRNMVLVTSS